MYHHLSATLAGLILPVLAAGLRSQGKATVSIGVHSTLGSGYTSSHNECPKDVSHKDDLYRPIKQVAHEHPGQDLNCYFHWYAPYLGNPTSYVNHFYHNVKHFTPENGRRGPELKLHLTNGEVLTTHNDAKVGKFGNYALDDAMCYQMGWMKGQRLDDKVMSMKSEEEWFKIAEEECKRLPLLVNRTLTDENSKYMTIGYMHRDLLRIHGASRCLRLDPSARCKKATIEDWVKHIYPKCLLGHDDRLTGAAGQIGWCFARACVTKGGVIKHGAECWPEGLPNLGPSEDEEGAREAWKTLQQ